MKYHLQILKKYLSVAADVQDIAQNLILKTCEIEEVKERIIPKTIVIGKIMGITKHPDADKLNVCQVNCGDKGLFQIICGGTNVAEGIFVATALVGTPFPEAGITIAKRAMRGVDSEGMICSKGELGIDEDKDTHWIWDLAQDLEVSDEDIGLPLSDKFPWLESTTLEVDSKSLTNRPDLTGHFGLAVELNAIYPEAQKKFNGIKPRMQTFEDTNILEVLANTEKVLDRKVIGTSEGLNSYIALELKNIEVKKSDFFTRLQLIDLGSNPINNRVDFSNLFMNTTGHPVHFFDAEKIKGDLVIRDAKEGEKFIDLFGTEHTLQPSDLVIADEEKVLALGGVIGGLESGITASTKNIIVEIANFDPVKVRKTGTRLGLRTDAELRYEKNINPAFSLYALLFFLEELKFYSKDLGNYEIGGIGHYIKPGLNPLAPKIIPTPRKQMENLIFGQEQEKFQEKAELILKHLGFKVQGETAVSPLWRGPEDINISEDLSEEVARIWGYENIAPQAVISKLKPEPFKDGVAILREVESMMVERFHFDQLETYPWVSVAQVKAFERDTSMLYSIANPLNPEFPLFRDQMIYNLLTISAKNSKFFDHFRIFDIGKVWKKNTPNQEEILDPRYAANHFTEELTLGACRYEKSINARTDDPFLKAKTMLMQIFKSLEIKGKISFEQSNNTAFHPKKQARIILRNGPTPLEIGYLATLHPLLLKQNKLPENAQLACVEVNLELLKKYMHQNAHQNDYETLQDQILWRDLSFVIDADKEFSPIITAIESLKDIHEVKVFDLYQGSNLGEGKKSLSLSIKIKGDGAMTTEQINTIMDNAIKKAASVGAALRA